MNFDPTGAHRSPRRSAQNGSGGDVELATVAATCDGRAIQLAFGEGASGVGARVVEGVQFSLRAHHIHPDPCDVEYTHVALGHVRRVTDSSERIPHLNCRVIVVMHSRSFHERELTHARAQRQ